MSSFTGVGGRVDSGVEHGDSPKQGRLTEPSSSTKCQDKLQELNAR